MQKFCDLIEAMDECNRAGHKRCQQVVLDECNRPGHKSCQQVVLDESVTLATAQKFCDLIENGEAGENAK